MRELALVAAAAGAAGSVGFLLRARQHPPLFLLVLFVIWDLAPFVVLAAATTVSARWPVPTRTALYYLTLVVTLGSLGVYTYVVLSPGNPTPAFVAVPLVAWLLMAVAGAIARFAIRKDGQT
ncbi:MAG: hypothetical protein ABI665_13755 [Vicinamibacterales bacterium]